MRIRILALSVLADIVPVICLAQVTAADYERATKLGDRFQGLAINIPDYSAFMLRCIAAASFFIPSGVLFSNMLA